MEKRLLLATFLSLVILILFQYLFGVKKPERNIHKSEKAASASRGLIEKRPLTKKKEVKINGSDFTVETKLARIVLTNLGGRIKAIYLKKYISDKNQPVNLIKRHRFDETYPLSIEFGDENITNKANNAIYETSYKKLETTEYEREREIAFKYIDAEGTRYSKSYIFKHDSYLIKVRLSIDNLPREEIKRPYKIIWAPGPGDSEDNSGRYKYNGSAVFLNKKLIQDKAKENAVPNKYHGEISWVALENKYFVVAMISPDRISTGIIQNSSNSEQAVGFEYILEDSGIEKKFQIYAGPKDSRMLKNSHPDLDKIIDFGWFSFLAIPLLQILNFLYHFTHNYGISIILLTGLIKIIFYPLSHKSYKSMRKMQEIQPKMKLIQERYKKDREKLNQEIMALYKEYKVNPLGGCLPMLLQIPVFFALYRVLLDAIELRNAPFIWWIKDLSAKDPYYFWPILMGLSMFIQQKMSPPVGDPRQNRIMLMMPVIFTVMFLNFPVGLVIYWLINNLLSIIQQYYITRGVGKPTRLK